MPVVRVDPRNLNAAIRAHIDRRSGQVEAAALETCNWGMAEAVAITNTEGLNDTGAYRKGFRVVQTGRWPELRNDAPHALFVENGRLAGAPPPPLAPLIGWVNRKLGLGGADGERVAWAIRHAIHKRGIRPRRVMFRAYQKMKVFYRVEVIRRLGGPVG